jgi:hypothetical protein
MKIERRARPARGKREIEREVSKLKRRPSVVELAHAQTTPMPSGRIDRSAERADIVPAPAIAQAAGLTKDRRNGLPPPRWRHVRHGAFLAMLSTEYHVN